MTGVLDILLDTVVFPPTDAGNAERIAAQHRDGLRFVPGIGWHEWDGRRWRRDDDGAAIRAALVSARTIHVEAARIEDRGDRKTQSEWAIKSESEQRIRAAVALAETQPTLIVRADQFDADPLLLNVANGILDLRSGELRPHARHDLATRLVPVPFDATARSKDWDQFVGSITEGDADQASFLQRLVGYSLTGDTSEEIVPFVHGPGASGKTTFLEAIRVVAGDYGAAADPRTFMTQRGSTGARNDLARLVGVRFVVAGEVDESQELDVATLKLITGGDTITTARFLYREHFEYQPQFTVWMVGNSRPRARAADTGLWRRVVEIPFTNAIPESDRDPGVKRRLTRDPAAQTAILAWAVAGAIQWHELGLGESQRVREATGDYRAEANPVERWLDEACDLGTDARASLTELHTAYVRWAKYNDADEISATALAKSLKSRGHTQQRTSQARYWIGIQPR